MACWTGCSSTGGVLELSAPSPLAEGGEGWGEEGRGRKGLTPSTVITSRPATRATGTKQLLMARQAAGRRAAPSSTATEQAPQSPSAQPSWAPVRPEARRKSSSVVFGEEPATRTVRLFKMNSNALLICSRHQLSYVAVHGEPPQALVCALGP